MLPHHSHCVGPPQVEHVVGELKSRAKMISTTEEIAQVGIRGRLRRRQATGATALPSPAPSLASTYLLAPGAPANSMMNIAMRLLRTLPAPRFDPAGGHHLRQRRARDWRADRAGHGEGAPPPACQPPALCCRCQPRVTTRRRRPCLPARGLLSRVVELCFGKMPPLRLRTLSIPLPPTPTYTTHPHPPTHIPPPPPTPPAGWQGGRDHGAGRQDPGERAGGGGGHEV